MQNQTRTVPNKCFTFKPLIAAVLAGTGCGTKKRSRKKNKKDRAKEKDKEETKANEEQCNAVQNSHRMRAGTGCGAKQNAKSISFVFSGFCVLSSSSFLCMNPPELLVARSLI